MHAAESLRKHAAAVRELQEHPIASLAAAISAAAALVSIITAKKHKAV
jgi:hypothetical protein